MQFTEHQLELSIMELFENEGYTHQTGNEIHRQKADVLLESLLSAYLRHRYAIVNNGKYKVTKADATYLMWVDVSATGKTGDNFAAELMEKTGVYISGGSQYGKSSGNFLGANAFASRTFSLR